MRNMYPGNCYRCGKMVEAMAGHFERKKDGWRVQHAECAIKYRGTAVKFEPGQAKIAEITGGTK